MFLLVIMFLASCSPFTVIQGDVSGMIHDDQIVVVESDHLCRGGIIRTMTDDARGLLMCQDGRVGEVRLKSGHGTVVIGDQSFSITY